MKISISNFSVVYRGRGREFLAADGVDLCLEQGRILGLVGQSGSGKSTVLNGILGLLPDGTETSGVIDVGGVNLLSLDEEGMRRWRWERISMVPQGAMNSFTPISTVGAQIGEVLRVHLGLKGRPARVKCEELLRSVGLEGSLGDRYPHELSGGQKQRAYIAMALCCEPSFLLADEPTTALDVISQREVLDTLVRQVRQRRMGMMLVTHDLALAGAVCDQLAVMQYGRIVEFGNAKAVLRAPGNEHTRDLIRALLEVERGSLFDMEGGCGCEG